MVKPGTSGGATPPRSYGTPWPTRYMTGCSDVLLLRPASSLTGFGISYATQPNAVLTTSVGAARAARNCPAARRSASNASSVRIAGTGPFAAANSQGTIGQATAASATSLSAAF